MIVEKTLKTRILFLSAACLLGWLLPAASRAATFSLAGKALVLNTANSYLDFSGTYNSNASVNSVTGNFSGYAYLEDAGWVAFGTADNAEGPVNVSVATGAVTGQAKVLNTGVDLDFDNYNSNVELNLATGVFSGYVFSEDMGWINFGNTGVTTEPFLPAAANGFSGTADSATAITWSWTDNADNETGFKIYSNTDALIATVALANATSYQETGLTAATAYTRKVVVYNSAGEGTASSTAATSTQTGIPTAPSGFGGEVLSGTSLRWSWTDNADDETGFKIYDGSGNLIATIATANTTSYDETGLVQNTLYTRYVKAYTAYGESVASDSAAVRTSATVPAAPSLFSGTAPSSTKITWSWADNSDNETGFKIYDGSDNLIATIATASTTSYDETGLTKDTRYTRKILAYNGNGNSAATGVITVTTKAQAPSTPGLKSPTDSALLNTQTPAFVFERSADLDDGMDKYTLLIDEGESRAKSITIANVAAGATHTNADGTASGTADRLTFTLSDNNALSEGSHAWKIRATDLGANTANSETATFIINLSLPVFTGITVEPSEADGSEFITSDTNPTLTFKLSDDRGLSLLAVKIQKRRFFLGAAIFNTTVLEKAYVLSGTAATVELPLRLTEGVYLISATVTDDAGNATDESLTLRVAAPAAKVALTQKPKNLEEAEQKMLKGEPLGITPSDLQLPNLEKQALIRRASEAQNFIGYLARLKAPFNSEVLRGMVNSFGDSIRIAGERFGASMRVFGAGLTQMANNSGVRLLARLGEGLEKLGTNAADIARAADRAAALIADSLGAGTERLAKAWLSAGAKLKPIARMAATAGGMMRDAGKTAQGTVIDGLQGSGRALAVVLPRSLEQAARKAGHSASRLAGQARDNQLELGKSQEKRLVSLFSPLLRVGRRVPLTVRLAINILRGAEENPLVISDITVESLTSTQAVISWQTTRLTRGKVNYGFSLTYGEEVIVNEFKTKHRAVLANLKPRTRQYFEVVATDTNDVTVYDAYYSFETPGE